MHQIGTCEMLGWWDICGAKARITAADDTWRTWGPRRRHLRVRGRPIRGRCQNMEMHRVLPETPLTDFQLRSRLSEMKHSNIVRTMWILPDGITKRKKATTNRFQQNKNFHKTKSLGVYEKLLSGIHRQRSGWTQSHSLKSKWFPYLRQLLDNIKETKNGRIQWKQICVKQIQKLRIATS